MTKYRKHTSEERRAEAEYWDSHTLDEDRGAPLRLEVRRPLASVLTLRLDEGHLRKLRSMAAEQGLGVTTMARHILCSAVDGGESGGSARPARQSRRPNAPEDEAERSSLLVVPTEALADLPEAALAGLALLMRDLLRERSVSGTPDNQELFARLREISARPL